MCMQKLLTALLTVSLCLLLSVNALAAEVTVTTIDRTGGTVEAISVYLGAGSTEPEQHSDAINLPTNEVVYSAPSSDSAVAVPITAIMSGPQPVNIETITENGVVIIKKTFESTLGVNPQTLVQPFEQGGYRFVFREIFTHELPGEAITRPASKTAVTITNSNDADEIRRQFPSYIEYSDNEHFGRLYLDASTISTRADGAETYTYTFNRAREVPCLPRNDPALIERTWNGLALTNVSFARGRDGLYTATAIYTGTNTVRRTVSFITTARYTGEIAMTLLGNTLYTIVYVGTPIPMETQTGTQTQAGHGGHTQTQPPALIDISNGGVATQPEPSAQQPDEAIERVITPEVAAPIIPDAPTRASTLLDRLLGAYLFPTVTGVIFLLGAVIVPLYTTKKLRKERKENRDAIREIKKFVQEKD